MYIEIKGDLVSLDGWKSITIADEMNYYKGFVEHIICFESADNKSCHNKVYYFNSKKERDRIFNEIKQITTKKD